MAGFEDLSKSIPVIPNKQMVTRIGNKDISFMVMPIYQSDGYSLTIYSSIIDSEELDRILFEMEDRLNIYIESYTIIT